MQECLIDIPRKSNIFACVNYLLLFYFFVEDT